MPTLLLTRPNVDSKPLIDALDTMGVRTIQSPLMNIEFFDGPAISLDGIQAVLVTSANGVRALAKRASERTLPMLAVGDATAREAIKAGFEDVKSASGDVEDLAALVARECSPDDGALVHIAGTVQAGDLAGALKSVGFDVRREVLYTAESQDALDKGAILAMKQRSLDGVVIYSPRTARIFDQIIEKQGLSGEIMSLTLFALSQNVSDATRLNWQERFIAEQPTQESLLKAVRACYY